MCIQTFDTGVTNNKTKKKTLDEMGKIISAQLMQLVIMMHEDTIMDQSLFRRNEIWFVERDADCASRIYSLDRFKERYDKKLSKAYLEGRYGTIPVFKQFSFREEE